MLAQELGLSRVAVWKHVERLRQQGLDISAVAGLGYQLHSDVLCDKALLASLRQNNCIGKQVYCLAELDSTNREVMRQAEAGADEGLVVCADTQTQGRGRLGRSWTTLNDALAMSVLLRPLVSPVVVPELSLLTAVAVQQGLMQSCDGIVTDKDVCIKWPNDLVVNGEKIAGILTEMRAEPQCVQAVVVGIGVNMQPPKGGWEQATTWLADDSGTTRRATDIATWAASQMSRLTVATHILQALDAWYGHWQEEGFGVVREAWWRVHVASGQEVRVYDGDTYIEGIAEALDDDGALLLRTAKGVQRIISGDLEYQ